MILLQLVIHGLLVSKILLAPSLCLNLFIEFASNETLTLCLTHDGLLLLFEVEQLIELLYGGPLVFLRYFRVNFCRGNA